ncbi:heterokaryon incompatibility protein-domain-containing protein [Echria macrotheca]|uniref:Heterokaryon incompatibility protein-domain-containing protein n=1 Tax=Echria macrotheca TaxID=438768 RepID=A0AAJ0F4F2_9PEZI|nr:heterokaryon incompatibility protein-domain-containing protein [Echria macrotheca]
MRLINAETLAMEEFYGDVPRYAILSHRWQDEEVTFKDYTFPDLARARQMKGFRKILFCADQAKKDKVKHFWIDTCCIDKSSSAELSEAINSMYAWYRDSLYCYIYMVDVDASAILFSGKQKSEKEVEQFEAAFQASQWFNRGWTLQELLAPSFKKFYDCNWGNIMTIRRGKNLEDKYIRSVTGGLATKLSTTTGITKGMLRDFSATSRDYSVALKMSWAATRQTTRVEDMAYCLMGIFDINMPLLYGEGTKAFTRLQEEIIKKTYDHSIFCWRNPSSGPSTYRGLLARSPAEFRVSASVRASQRPYDDSVENEDTGPSLKTYGMTNRGLRISFRMLEISGGEYVAKLECEEKQLPCFLMLARLGGGQYARIESASFWQPSKERFKLPERIVPADWKEREICVQENLEIYPGYASPRVGSVSFHVPNENVADISLAQVLDPKISYWPREGGGGPSMKVALSHLPEGTGNHEKAWKVLDESKLYVSFDIVPRAGRRRRFAIGLEWGVPEPGDATNPQNTGAALRYPKPKAFFVGRSQAAFLNMLARINGFAVQIEGESQIMIEDQSGGTAVRLQQHAFLDGDELAMQITLTASHEIMRRKSA